MEKEQEASHLDEKSQESNPHSDGSRGEILNNSDISGLPYEKPGLMGDSGSQPQAPEPQKSISENQKPVNHPPEPGKTEVKPETLSSSEQSPSEQTEYYPEASPYDPAYQPPDYYSGSEQDSTSLSSSETVPADSYKYEQTSSSNINDDQQYSDSGSGGSPPDTTESDVSGEEEGGGPVKPFLEHLEDLRWTLVKSVTAVILGMLVCLVAGRYLVSFLMAPLHRAEEIFLSSKSEVAIMIGTNVIARGDSEKLGLKPLFGSNVPPALQIVPVQIGTNAILGLQTVTNKEYIPGQRMVVIKNYSPVEGIMVALKLALFGGIVVSFPFVMYFIGQFVLPALHVHEKKILFKAVGFSGGLFLLGVIFSYFIVLVFALGATVQFSQWLGFGADEWRADAYLSFVVKFMLGMGLAFQMPVIILLLVKIGLLDYEKLKNFRTYAFVANLVISAVVTPSGDPFTMLAMALPLHVLYEISTFIAWIWHRRDLKRAAEENN